MITTAKGPNVVANANTLAATAPAIIPAQPQLKFVGLSYNVAISLPLLVLTVV